MCADALSNTPQSSAKLKAIEHTLFSGAEPSVLLPGDDRNPIDADKKAMESLFSVLEERGVNQPKKLTEFEVYARLEEYGKRAKPK